MLPVLISLTCLRNSVYSVKTEKKTVQFSEDIQVETIEPEPEPVYIDEVRVPPNVFYTVKRTVLIWAAQINDVCSY